MDVSISEIDDELLDFDSERPTPLPSPDPSARSNSVRTGSGKPMGSASFSDRFRRVSTAPAPASRSSGVTKFWKARQSQTVDQSLNLMDRESYTVQDGEKSMVDLHLSKSWDHGSSSSFDYSHRASGKTVDSNRSSRKWRLFVVFLSVTVLATILLLVVPPFGLIYSKAKDEENKAESKPPAPKPQQEEEEKIKEPEAELPLEQQEEATSEGQAKEPETELPSEQEVPLETEQLEEPVSAEQEEETVSAEQEEETIPSATEATTEEELDVDQVPLSSRLEALKFFVVDQGVSAESHLNDEGSPSQKALGWIAQSDPARLPIPGIEAVDASEGKTKEAILQRFALAVFYFSMMEEPVSSKQAGPSGRQLQQAQNEQEMANHQAFEKTWMSAEPVCQWHGVKCAENGMSVIKVSLSKHMLQGTIPRELLDGAAMPHLLHVDLSQNLLEGELPLVTQEREDAGQQLGVSPPTSPLQVLQLNENHLSGNLDVILGFPKLKELGMAHNRLTGTIPVGIAQLSFLERLNLEGNQVTGSIPTMGESIQQLHLAVNGLTGGVPTQLHTLTNLQELTLSQNHVTGTIHTTVGDTTTLKTLHLDGNELEGTIPSNLGQLTQLERLHLDGNHLTGEMPQEVCSLRDDAALDVLVSQCRGINCDCCTDCF